MKSSITAVNVVERPPLPVITRFQRGNAAALTGLWRARCARAPRSPVPSRRSPSASVGACGAGKDWSLPECLHCEHAEQWGQRKSDWRMRSRVRVRYLEV